MAARYPAVNDAIRRALPDPMPRGSQTRLAAALGVSQPTVQRWFAGESSPDPEMWAAIERTMDMEAGTLRSAALRRTGASSAEHQARIDGVEEVLSQLVAHVVELGSASGITSAGFTRRQKQLQAYLRRDGASGRGHAPIG